MSTDITYTPEDWDEMAEFFSKTIDNITAMDRFFFDIVKCKQKPLTNKILTVLIKRNPERWGQYERFIGKLKD